MQGAIPPTAMSFFNDPVNKDSLLSRGEEGLRGIELGDGAMSMIVIRQHAGRNAIFQTGMAE